MNDPLGIDAFESGADQSGNTDAALALMNDADFASEDDVDKAEEQGVRLINMHTGRVASNFAVVNGTLKFKAGAAISMEDIHDYQEYKKDDTLFRAVYVDNEFHVRIYNISRTHDMVRETSEDALAGNVVMGNVQ